MFIFRLWCSLYISKSFAFFKYNPSFKLYQSRAKYITNSPPIDPSLGRYEQEQDGSSTDLPATMLSKNVPRSVDLLLDTNSPTEPDFRSDTNNAIRQTLLYQNQFHWYDIQHTKTNTN